MIPDHTRDRTGIFPEKLPMLIAEKKKGRKKIRYIRPIDVQTNAYVRLNSLSPLLKKKERTIMPAPARKRINLKIND
jgi:hypothetical protein